MTLDLSWKNHNAPADIHNVWQCLHKLLIARIIKEPCSLYTLPIAVTRKKKGSIRMYIDYSFLMREPFRTCTQSPELMMPWTVWWSCFFFVLDQRNGYFQIAMAKKDIENNSLYMPAGVLPVQIYAPGHHRSPSHISAANKKSCGRYTLFWCLVFLDYLMVFGRTLDEHKEHLLKVLNQYQEYGLKLSIDKRQFCQPQVKYISHIQLDPHLHCHLSENNLLSCTCSCSGFCQPNKAIYCKWTSASVACVQCLTRNTLRGCSLQPLPAFATLSIN